MGNRRKRRPEIVILSDVHLGTYGCHAEELLRYLKSIKPQKLILNGDIIDMWQFSKRYWPRAHMQVIKHITGLLAKGTRVIYLTGNHDEMLRKFAGFRLGPLQIDNKLVLKINGQKAWIFHGDVFDVTMRYSRWLARLGAVGYDLLILINTFVNWILKKTGRGRISLSRRVKDSVKTAVKFINDFENTAAGIAVDNGYHYVICGHIHQPEIRTINNEKGTVIYMNSGDWVENLTALEFDGEKWSLYRYADDPVARSVKLPKKLRDRMENEEIFRDLVNEFLTPEK